MTRPVHNHEDVLTFAGLLSLPEWDPRFKRRQMDAFRRKHLLAVLGAAIDRDPQAVAYFLERELLNYFSATVIGEDNDWRREHTLRGIRRQAERLGMSVKQVYFDPDDPSRVVIEPREEWMPPV